MIFRYAAVFPLLLVLAFSNSTCLSREYSRLRSNTYADRSEPTLISRVSISIAATPKEWPPSLASRRLVFSPSESLHKLYSCGILQ
ncbi:hypothetical protein R3P38DRAFT_323686 [Favolaschia claudopus]|uniref:Secreted protein n=1 Tax=Favolaschia claudopus TaxID=2862362 RepID=A0AAW0CVV6_9AGAR